MVLTCYSLLKLRNAIIWIFRRWRVEMTQIKVVELRMCGYTSPKEKIDTPQSGTSGGLILPKKFFLKSEWWAPDIKFLNSCHISFLSFAGHRLSILWETNQKEILCIFELAGNSKKKTDFLGKLNIGNIPHDCHPNCL